VVVGRSQEADDGEPTARKSSQNYMTLYLQISSRRGGPTAGSGSRASEAAGLVARSLLSASPMTNHANSTMSRALNVINVEGGSKRDGRDSV
jgi:hypothetical protein